MKRVTSALTAALFGPLLAAGCTTQPGGVARHATPDDILGSIEDPEKRQRWQDAIDAGDTPPVSAIEVPAAPLATRETPANLELDRPARTPGLAPNAAADINPLSLETVGAYQGPAQVLQLAEDHLSLAVEGRDVPLVILYRAPSERPLAGLDTGDEVNLHVGASDSPVLAQQYDVAVAGLDGRAAFVYLLESNDSPIRRSYDIARVRIRQLFDGQGTEKSDSGRSLPVEVHIDDHEIVLQPGQVLRAEEWDAPYDVVLFHSMAYPEQAQWADTPPFALNLAIFAAE